MERPGHNAERTTPVRPADAAGLVLIRAPRRGPPEILIGRRPAKMGFLPGIHVVPGGRVDRSDRVVGSDRVIGGDPHPDVARHLGGPAPASFIHAALRETFEETGLLVGRPGALPAGIAPAPLWKAYADAGMAPDLAGFDYVCRAITPVGSRRRYNTRFFLGDGALAAGELAGDGELEDLAWRPFGALSGLTLVDVTEYVLKTAIRRWQAGVPIGAEPPKLLNYRNNTMTLSRLRQRAGLEPGTFP